MKDDLINRSLFIETTRFDANQKRERELILKEEFKKDLPYILGGIFASISEALKIYSTLEDISAKDENIRMLDFALFGEALSRVWGNEKMKFFEIYGNMQSDKISEDIKENPTLNTLVSYIKKEKSYYGSLGDLLNILKDHYISNKMGENTCYFVSGPTSFSKKLKEKDNALYSMGIEVIPDEKQTKGKVYYQISYNPERMIKRGGKSL